MELLDNANAARAYQRRRKMDEFKSPLALRSGKIGNQLRWKVVRVNEG